MKKKVKNTDYYLNDIGTSANLIIIDSFSNDNTPKIIKEYCKKFKNVKYIQKKNQGTTETQEYMNWFLENVISDYYIFLSCSEIITRDTFELFNNYMKKEIDLLYVNRKSILNGRDISYVYSKLIDLILFKTYMPLCRLASNSGLKKIKCLFMITGYQSLIKLIPNLLKIINIIFCIIRIIHSELIL